MSDRYTFRAKRMNTDKWKYGYLTLGKSWIVEGLTPHIQTELDAPNRIVCSEIDPSTIGQCTGLKDKNGKLIFEGDIVRCTAGEAYNGIHEYDCNVEVVAGWTQSMWEMLQCDELEVLGNVFDNPDLLKGATT